MYESQWGSLAAASLVPRPPFNTARGGSGNETMQHKSHKNPNQYCPVRIRIRYLLQVTHTAPELAMKSKARMIKSLSP